MDRRADVRSDILLDLMLRKCALACSTPNSDRDCVKGCALAAEKPLRAASLAIHILGLEDEESFDSVLTDLDRTTAENRLVSLSQGVERACRTECAQSCGDQDTNCQTSCRKGCELFVQPLLAGLKKKA